MDWREAKARLLQDQGRREAYEKVDLEYEIGKMIADARIAKKMTQEKLAELVGTKQPSIARLEAGSALPSLSFLQKVAAAFGTQLLPPRLQLLEDSRVTCTFTQRPITFADYNLDQEPILSFDFVGLTPERGIYAYYNS